MKMFSLLPWLSKGPKKEELWTIRIHVLHCSTENLFWALIWVVQALAICPEKYIQLLHNKHWSRFIVIKTSFPFFLFPVVHTRGVGEIFNSLRKIAPLSPLLPPPPPHITRAARRGCACSSLGSSIRSSYTAVVRVTKTWNSVLKMRLLECGKIIYGWLFHFKTSCSKVNKDTWRYVTLSFYLS